MSDSDISVSGYDHTGGDWVVVRKKRNRKRTRDETSLRTNPEETVPKSIFEQDQPTAASAQLPSTNTFAHNAEDNGRASERTVISAPRPTLQELIPTNATSAEKKRLIAESDLVFSGRYDPTAVCCVMVSMDEPDLRELRELLHAALTATIPAVAGRPLCRRVNGNLSGLADDCWSLGYSAAQGVLTQRANTATLKPAGRNPLPTPGSTRSAPPDSVASGPSAITTSLEAIISTQLRMENEIKEFRARQATQDAYKARLRSLEVEVARMREECAVRDDTIAQLKLFVESALACEGPQSHRPASSEQHAAPGRQVTGVEPAADAAATAAEAHANRIAAREIAASLDLRALGESIACALQWRVGDSDSEPEQQNARAERVRGTAQPLDRCRTAKLTATPTSNTPVTAPGEPTRRPDMVTGSGPPSALIRDPSRHGSLKKFILEGFRLDVTDSDVRSLVWTVVRNLHDFQRLSRRGSADSVSKAFQIEVDADDTDRILDPSSWPAGLVVRHVTRDLNPGRQGQRFRPQASSGKSQAARRGAARAEYGGASRQTAAPRRYSDAVRNTARDGAAWMSAAQRRNEQGNWGTATSHYSRAANRGSAHDSGASRTIDTPGRDRSDVTHGDGCWEYELPRCYGPAVQTRYHGHHDDNTWMPAFQRRDGDENWTAAAPPRPGAANRVSGRDASASWVSAVSHGGGSGATHGGGGWRWHNQRERGSANYWE